MVNSSFLIGVTSRPKAADSQLRLTVTTPDGTRCGSTWPSAMGLANASRGLLTGMLSTASDSDWKKTCRTGDLVLKVQQTDWGDDVAGTPMQLNVVETPAPTNASALKGEGSASDVTWSPMPAPVPHGTTVGGTGLASATRLTSGTTSLELVPGELKFFKVSATWGQQVQAIATAEQNPAYDTPGLRDFTVNILSPVGGDVDATFPDNMPEGDAGSLSDHAFVDEDGARIAAATTPIRLSNRTSFHEATVGTSIAGDYYIVVGLGATSSENTTVRTPLKVELQVGTPHTEDVTAPSFAGHDTIKAAGRAAGQDDASAGPSSSPSPSSGAMTSVAPSSASGTPVQAAGSPADAAPSAQDSRHTDWPVIGGLSGAAALLAIIGAGAAIALRRR